MADTADPDHTFTNLPDLASRRMGGSVVSATDELFAHRESLILPDPPIFRPATFGHKGQEYDGWETRRRRDGGHDHATIRLGLPGIVRGVVIDTTFFTGNYPPAAALQGCGVDGHPSPAELDAADWIDLLERAALAGDAPNPFSISSDVRVTHVRLSIFPDGGVSRLRVHGDPVPDPLFLDGDGIDLAALDNGGAILDVSNRHYSSPSNLIAPGHARVMGEGWETARRRDDGNDWVDVALAGRGVIRVAELDTTHFVGNAPGWASLTGDDDGDPVVLLPRARLQPDTRHRFLLEDAPPVSRVRLDVFPDGGLARLRLLGGLTSQARADLALRWLNTIPASQARQTLLRCCAAPVWADQVAARRRFDDIDALLRASDAAFTDLPVNDLQSALAAHPRIGDRPTGPDAAASRREQAGMADAGREVAEALRRGNVDYEDRFGHVFLIRASGRSAQQMLDVLHQRLGNDRETEWRQVTEQLRQITTGRLRRLIAGLDRPEDSR